MEVEENLYGLPFLDTGAPMQVLKVKIAPTALKLTKVPESAKLLEVEKAESRGCPEIPESPEIPQRPRNPIKQKSQEVADVLKSRKFRQVVEILTVLNALKAGEFKDARDIGWQSKRAALPEIP